MTKEFVLSRQNTVTHNKFTLLFNYLADPLQTYTLMLCNIKLE